ncbi:cytochrome oxidase subunit II domain protein [Bordetella bronchiseptica B20-10725633]|nr:cytochrome oxidase subunit II domain protein [Bordetella bronchiseptica B20-10725633]
MIATLAASLGLSPDDPSFWMPLVFVGLLLLLMAAGIVLDGFDIGVGLLLQLAPSEERGRMMGLLSPWRDANEFWPLLGLGLFVSAFPFAWGVVLGKLFGPLTVMALGMVLRSVSFEFRIRARTEIKPRWIFGFWVGSLLTALGQGMVLGRIATDYQADAGYGWFAFFVGLCAMAAYALLGACWLVMRVDGELQRRAAGCSGCSGRWADWAPWPARTTTSRPMRPSASPTPSSATSRKPTACMACSTASWRSASSSPATTRSPTWRPIPGSCRTSARART